MPKELDEFGVEKRAKDGLQSACKMCRREGNKKYYALNSKKHIEKTNQYRREHLEQSKKYTEKYRLNHPEKAKESLKKADKKWKLNHPEKVKEWCKKAQAKRNNTPKGKLNVCLSRGIYQSLKGSKKGRHWESLVDYTVDQLKQHIEKLFKPGMSWDNYGSAWHIDHKIPIAVFNFQHPEHIDFKLCWSLKNLQPLEKEINLSKKATLEKPFQPSLLIEQKENAI